MARAGLFNDLDVCLDWHPDYENKANMQSSQAIADYTITFKGKVLMQQQIPGTVGAH
jgi:aminobenzoyl-glutamate utilization protein B